MSATEDNNYELPGLKMSFSERMDPNDFTGTYDYVMVLPYAAEQPKETKYCVDSLLNAGLEIFPYPSVQGDELYVLIRCPTVR